ncbi:hypothetical protein ACQP1K_08535 [Sphaerimonospora sp. CA-214678]|uniref:hypothetical protein n=1 Tax=Sphaerimonospora sp. CA-214678 TaxID=3240029 RepID=UPI003D9393B3
MAVLVPNPLYLALRDALRTAEPMLAEIEKGIETQFRTFHQGGVWKGPAAKRFDEQLTHHRTRVSGCADAILSDLRRALAGTPPEVSEDQARSIRIRYGLP